MAEVDRYIFSYKEVAAALVKAEGIHEGLWAISIEFGLGAGNVQSPDDSTLLIAAVVTVNRIGIQRATEATNHTVDASEVNPKSKARSGRPKQKADTEG